MTLAESLRALKAAQEATAEHKRILEQEYQNLLQVQAFNGGLTDDENLHIKRLQDQAAEIAKLESINHDQEQQLISIHGAEMVLQVAKALQSSSTDDGSTRLIMEKSDTVMILCCQCGIPTSLNEARLCLQCLKNEANILQGISDTSYVVFCRSCERYESKPTWLRCEWESKELLALCLKRFKKKTDTRLVGAEFVWTEPHSRRIKIHIELEKDVFNATLRQSLVITYVINYRQCDECTKSVTPHIWVSNVQVRQRAAHKRTMLFLEQLILRNKAHKDCVNIIDLQDGLDFHFAKPQHAATLVQFIRQSLCCKVHPIATQMISQDPRNNIARNKYTQMIEICDVCRDDLVFIPKKMATQLGGCAQIMLCRRISTGVHLVDPFTLRGVDLDCEKYWKNPFSSCKSFLTHRFPSSFQS